jgi:phosphate transport system protein
MITAMGRLAIEQLEAASDAAERSDPDLASRVIEREPEADRLAHEVESLVIRILALRQPMAIDLRQVLSALKIAAELERICDHAKDLAQRLIALSTAGVELLPSLIELARFAAAMVNDAMHAYAGMNATDARAVWNRDSELDAKYTALFREVLTYMLEDPRRIAANTQILFMARTIERIGDRATNIAEITVYLVRGVPIEEERPKADTTKSMIAPAPSSAPEPPPRLASFAGNEEADMLHEIQILEARRIAELAAAARDARDRAFAPVPEAELGEPQPARGQHHPAGALGFIEGAAHRALREAIEGLPDDIRRKLWAVMRTGSGDYAKADWPEATTAALNLPEENIIADLVQEVDLHDRLMKGLYEIGAAEPWQPPA